MITTFAVGLLFGLRHALDADHIAAVASLATRAGSRGETVRVGIAWGLGHALTLFLVCAVVLAMDIGFPERLAQLAEFLVGAMLLFLGLGVVRRAWRGRLHIHGHDHGAGYHVHVHSHAGEAGQHARSPHRHQHARGLPKRAVLVGLMHGLAGSAALLLLSVGAQGTVVFGLAYVALFGIGSMIGMAVLSATMSYPLRIAGRVSAWGFNALYGVIGVATVVLGILVMAETGSQAASWLALL